MTPLAIAVFVLTYIGMALGCVPGFKIDRSGTALIAAVILVATDEIPANQVTSSIHFPTLMLLGGLMILSARVPAAGTLSAVLVNDIVVFAMTPLLCAGLSAKKLDPRPFLFALVAASNVGSAATLIGNPQNILIGQVGRLGFWSYFAIASVPWFVARSRIHPSAALAPSMQHDRQCSRSGHDPAGLA